jgi:UDP-N-acetyl-2-amino-2-deoxyglucuronate dehydrogenase
MVDFALIGAAGFVAPRHMQAIKDVGGRLVAAMDPSDSVGVLDRYFPEAEFFTEPERFDRYLEKRRREGNPVDYISICSPNYLHDAHVRQALRVGAHAICEKPLVISPWNLDALAELEQKYDRRVYAVLQLRHHPEVIALKKRFENYSGPPVPVELTYVTPRGPWYHVSWKGDPARSGGLLMNIGIHFFDLLLWVFGSCQSATLRGKSEKEMSGELQMRRARVKWELSTGASPTLPTTGVRHLSVEGLTCDLSTGAEGLFSLVYGSVLSGKGWGIEDAHPAIELVHRLRELSVS